MTYLDQKARDQVTGNFDVTFCVEAGAGTGKTSLMVRRVVEQVRAGVRVSEIVAITFTEKAAGELKHRIRQALESQRREHPESATVFARALADLDNAQISTIHGFAASILRERPVEARVDPNFVQLDELGSTLLLDEVWQKWLQKALGESNPVLKRALICGLKISKMYELFKSLHDQRQYLECLPTSSEKVEDKCRELLGIVESVMPLLQHCHREDDPGLLQWQNVIRVLEQRYYSTLSGDPSQVDPDNLIRCLRDLKINRRSGNNNNWFGHHNSEQKELAEKFFLIRNSIYSLVLEQLLHLLAGAVRAVEGAKEERNSLDFDDLLIKTRNLLRDDKGVRAYFQKRFRSVIVDEFQDTDPLQVEIVFFLCEQDSAAENWDEVILRPGKLCIVGDPKQSIYRFRRADIEIYMNVQESIRSQGKVLQIQQNFRSAPLLVDWINKIFSQMIKPEEKYQPEYHPLLTAEPEPGPEKPCVTVLYNEQPLKGADEYRAAEGNAVVSVLRRILDEGWPVREKGSGLLRPARWGDIAVLFFSLTKSYLYEGPLRAADIPYRLDGGKQFFSRQEIHSLVACLKAIDDPSDQIALVACLHSLFFGFSDEELFRFRSLQGSFSYYKSDEASPELSSALALLRSLHEERNRVSFAYTLERLFRETHALEKHLLIRYGNQAIANLQKAVARARAFEQAGATTFRRFVRWINQLEQDTRPEPESALIEAYDDAVELLTIHKSKGLEFPIVILANLNVKDSDRLNDAFDRERRSLEFHITNEDKLVLETSGFEVARAIEQKRLDAEKKRLLYVAATRARDYLLVSGFQYGRQPSGLCEKLEEYLPDPGLIPEGEQETIHDGIGIWRVPPTELQRDPELSTSIGIAPEKESTWTDQLESWKKDRTEVLRRASISWAPVTASEAKPELAEASFAAPRAFVTREASALGSAYHRLMYRIPQPDLVEGYQADRFVALVEQTALEYGLNEPAGLFELARRAFPESLHKLLRSCRRIQREVPFLLRCSGLEARLAGAADAFNKKFPNLFEGVMDLVGEAADGRLFVLDYKTDSVTGREIPERMTVYRQQGEIYRAALEKVAGRPVQDVFFYFVRPGVMVGLSTNFNEFHEVI
jgi:ATP-dependent exoDNAse (exonuclease V) beta subunit